LRDGGCGAPVVVGAAHALYGLLCVDESCFGANRSHAVRDREGAFGFRGATVVCFAEQVGELDSSALAGRNDSDEDEAVAWAVCAGHVDVQFPSAAAACAPLDGELWPCGCAEEGQDYAGGAEAGAGSLRVDVGELAGWLLEGGPGAQSDGVVLAGGDGEVDGNL
jgi:hypothetical protein